MRLLDGLRRYALWVVAIAAGILDAQLPAHPTDVALVFALAVGLLNLIALAVLITYAVLWIRSLRRSGPKSS